MSSPAVPSIPYRPFDPGTSPEEASQQLYEALRLRRSVRAFSDRPVSRQTIEWLIRAAGTAPSGANKQPWRFVAVSDSALKREIRLAAEVEERAFYDHRATPAWLADLAPIGTGWDKPFLERAPWLIVVFKLTQTDEGGPVYYATESVGLATGILIAAAHFAGLATLTHTPSPMRFLGRVLGRPENERPFLLVPIGYPEEACEVPDLSRKPLAEILIHDKS